MAFKSILPGLAARPKMEMKKIPGPEVMKKLLSENFDLTTVLLIGGFIQGTILLIVPRVWALLPTLIILVARFARTLAITFNLIPNPQMKDAMTYRTTVVIPDSEGEFNTENHPSKEKIAILLLGLRINHPLGYFSHGMKEIADFNKHMFHALDSEAPNNGFLGQTQWTTQSETGSQEILFISYWRTIEDILTFSQGPTHKNTWNWWDDNAKSLKHIGISHEIFQADKALYETVYLNFQPTRLGATSYFRRGDESLGGTVPDQWVSPLVDASRGKLRTSMGRLGWRTEVEREKLAEKEGLGGGYKD